MNNLTPTVSTDSYSDLAPPSASKFLGLPLKVRLQVYRYLAPQHDGTLMDRSASPGIVQQEPRPCSLAPLLVCSQIYQEAIPIWYKYAVFRLAGSRMGLRNKRFVKKNKPGSKYAVSSDRYPLPLSNLHLCVNIDLDLHFQLPPPTAVQLDSAERTGIEHLVNVLTARKNHLRRLAIRPVFTPAFRARYFKLGRGEGINPNTSTQLTLDEAVEYNLRPLRPLLYSDDQVAVTLQDKWVAKRSMDPDSSQLSARSRWAQEQMDKFIEFCRIRLKTP